MERLYKGDVVNTLRRGYIKNRRHKMNTPLVRVLVSMDSLEGLSTAKNISGKLAGKVWAILGDALDEVDDYGLEPVRNELKEVLTTVRVARDVTGNVYRDVFKELATALEDYLCK